MRAKVKLVPVGNVFASVTITGEEPYILTSRIGENILFWTGTSSWVASGEAISVAVDKAKELSERHLWDLEIPRE